MMNFYLNLIILEINLLVIVVEEDMYIIEIVVGVIVGVFVFVIVIVVIVVFIRLVNILM